jgi:hypothetical protein
MTKIGHAMTKPEIRMHKTRNPHVQKIREGSAQLEPNNMGKIP